MLAIQAGPYRGPVLWKPAFAGWPALTTQQGACNICDRQPPTTSAVAGQTHHYPTSSISAMLRRLGHSQQDTALSQSSHQASNGPKQVQQQYGSQDATPMHYMHSRRLHAVPSPGKQARNNTEIALSLPDRDTLLHTSHSHSKKTLETQRKAQRRAGATQPQPPFGLSAHS